jgi:hypothetical protein
MAKRKERGAINGAFAWRLIEMLESPANRALSLSARRVLERLEIELYRHGGKLRRTASSPAPTSISSSSDCTLTRSHRRSVS